MLGTRAALWHLTVVNILVTWTGTAPLVVLVRPGCGADIARLPNATFRSQANSRSRAGSPFCRLRIRCQVGLRTWRKGCS